MIYNVILIAGIAVVVILALRGRGGRHDE